MGKYTHISMRDGQQMRKHTNIQKHTNLGKHTHKKKSPFKQKEFIILIDLFLKTFYCLMNA